MTPPPDTLHELNRQVGILIGEVAALRRDQAQADLKSDQSRANMHRRLDDLVDQNGEIDTTISVIGERMATVEKTLKDQVMPTVGKVQAWEQRGIGALAAVGLVSGGVGAFVATFWSDILAKLTRSG